MCYSQRTDDLGTTKEKRIALSSKMDCHSRNTTEKLVAYYQILPNTTKYYQILISKQLVKEVIRSLHRIFGKHPGITKAINVCREKYFYPKMAQLTGEWVMSSEECIKQSRIKRRLSRSSLQNPNEFGYSSQVKS